MNKGAGSKPVFRSHCKTSGRVGARPFCCPRDMALCFHVRDSVAAQSCLRAWRNGRRYGLKHRWITPCGFESRRPHRPIIQIQTYPTSGPHVTDDGHPSAQESAMSSRYYRSVHAQTSTPRIKTNAIRDRGNLPRAGHNARPGARLTGRPSHSVVGTFSVPMTSKPRPNGMAKQNEPTSQVTHRDQRACVFASMNTSIPSSTRCKAKANSSSPLSS